MAPGASSVARVSALDLRPEFASIVGEAGVRPSGKGDAVAGVAPQLVVEPRTEQELAGVLARADAADLAVLPRGGGSKMAWGNRPRRADLILSTALLNRIEEHTWADLTVVVEAGCTVAKLQQTLAQQGQRLALDALWPERATIGGVLATNDSGALRLRFGPLRDLIIGATLALPDGTLAKSGGKVVKNVAGYDLQKLATGALGTLGVITRAVFRLHPVPRKTQTITFSLCNLDEAQALILALQGSKLAHTALQLRFAAGAALAIDLLLEGTEEGIAAQKNTIEGMKGQASLGIASADVWEARQSLWDGSQPGAVAKIAVLPSEIAAIGRSFEHTAASRRLSWRAVIQATGVGVVRVEGAPDVLSTAISELRGGLPAGGSLGLLERAPGMESLDAWGYSGDALPLMKSVKARLDPKATLNPGRYVGGI